MNTQESQGNDLLLDSNRTGTKTVMHLHSLSWPDLKSTAIVLVVGGRRPLPSVDAMLYVGTWGWWKVWLPHFPKLPPLSSSNRPQLACSSFLDEPLFLPCVSALLLTSLWNRRSTRSSIITRCSVYLDTIHWMCNSISVHPSIATTAHHSREHSSPIHIQARPSHKLITCLCWVVDPEMCPLFNSSHSWIYRVTTIYWLLDLIKNTFVRVFVPLPQDKTNPEPRETMNAQWQSVWVSSSRAVTLNQFEGTTSPQLLLLLLVIDWTSPRALLSLVVLFFGCCCCLRGALQQKKGWLLCSEYKSRNLILCVGEGHSRWTLLVVARKVFVVGQSKVFAIITCFWYIVDSSKKNFLRVVLYRLLSTRTTTARKSSFACSMGIIQCISSSVRHSVNHITSIWITLHQTPTHKLNLVHHQVMTLGNCPKFHTFGN